MNLQIDQLAIHYLDPPGKTILFSKAPENVPALNPEIVDFFLRLVNEVVDSDDAGPTYSARFLGPNDPNGPSKIEQHVQNILADPNTFFDESKLIADHLFHVSTLAASPGVLAVILLHDPQEQGACVCLLKLRYEDRNFVALLTGSLTELTVEEIEYMLLEEIQKGAIIPHPDRKDYHLKLIDKQVPGEPAKYFKETFLGCWTKASDEAQVHGIIAALQGFAKEQKITVQKEKVPQVIAALQATKHDIDTEAVVETAVNADVFSKPVAVEQLKEFIDTKSDIGPIDIPQQSFTRRGKKGKTARQIRYQFVDPQYKGVVISGPVDVLSQILDVHGDTVSFSLQTTRNGFSVDYD